MSERDHRHKLPSMEPPLPKTGLPRPSKERPSGVRTMNAIGSGYNRLERGFISRRVFRPPRLWPPRAGARRRARSRNHSRALSCAPRRSSRAERQPRTRAPRQRRHARLYRDGALPSCPVRCFRLADVLSKAARLYRRRSHPPRVRHRQGPCSPEHGPFLSAACFSTGCSKLNAGHLDHPPTAGGPNRRRRRAIHRHHCACEPPRAARHLAAYGSANM